VSPLPPPFLTACQLQDGSIPLAASEKVFRVPEGMPIVLLGRADILWYCVKVQLCFM
jgi:hypothetical protein